MTPVLAAFWILDPIYGTMGRVLDHAQRAPHLHRRPQHRLALAQHRHGQAGGHVGNRELLVPKREE